MSETVFSVMPAAGSGWLVRRGTEDESAFFADRHRAIAYGQVLALDARPAILRVLSPAGVVEDEWLFGPQKGVRRVGPDMPRELRLLEA